MAKTSKLRDRGEQKEYIPNGNGRRKEWNSGRELFEQDAPPPGCNTDIWHLALYFRDKALEFDVVLQTGPVIIYGYLQKALTNLSPPDILARARTTGIQVTNGTEVWISVVERVIDEYITANYSAIDVVDLTTQVRFEFYLKRTIDTIAREQLIATGRVIPQEDRDVLPSRRTEEQQKAAEIRNRKYTEEELENKLKEFKSRLTLEGSEIVVQEEPLECGL